MIDHVRANNKACIVKRKGGGLPDREFDSVRDAADWCRETGRSRARPKLVIASIATRVFCGFIWTAEHVSSDDSVDRALISGNDAALPSLERADSVSASHDKTLTVRDIIDRTSEEVERRSGISQTSSGSWRKDSGSCNNWRITRRHMNMIETISSSHTGKKPHMEQIPFIRRPKDWPFPIPRNHRRSHQRPRRRHQTRGPLSGLSIR